MLYYTVFTYVKYAATLYNEMPLNVGDVCQKHIYLCYCATGWTVRGSNPGRGQIFRTCPDRPWGPLSLLYNGYWVFPGGKAAGAWC
jgi:hypothetical protein